MRMIGARKGPEFGCRITRDSQGELSRVVCSTVFCVILEHTTIPRAKMRDSIYLQVRGT